MKTLLAKDWRINRIVWLITILLVVLPYVTASSMIIIEYSPDFPGADAWSGLLRSVATISLVLSQAALAFIGGNSIACERQDRSAEFLVYLPISRYRILLSKFVVALLIVVGIWIVNLIVLKIVAPRLSGEPTSYMSVRSLWNVAGAGIVLFGGSWFFSVLVRNTTAAAVSGAIAPAMIFGFYMLLRLYTGFPEKVDLWIFPTFTIVGVLLFLAGCSIYLRRCEP